MKSNNKYLNEWKEYTIKDIGTVVTGNTPPKKDPENYGGNLVWIKPPDLDKKMFVSASEDTISEIGKKKARLLPKGSVLVSCIGNIGKIAIADCELSTNQQINSIIPNKDIVDSIFLYYAIKRMKPYLEKIASSAVVPLLNKNDFSKVKIKLPPLETQKKIVEILEKAEKLKEWRVEADELADEYLKSVFLVMFGDPQNNHHNFKVGKVQDLVIKTQYGTSSKANEENNGYPILRMNNITYHGKWDFSSLKHIELDEKDKKKYLVHNGELLFNRTNSKELVGKAAVYRRDELMAFAGYLVKLSTDSPATSEYIAAHLNSPYGKAVLFNMAKSIVGMANINAKEVQRVPILIPPMELREKYAEIVKRHEYLRESQAQSKQEIENLFNTLMQKAFKGELVC